MRKKKSDGIKGLLGLVIIPMILFFTVNTKVDAASLSFSQPLYTCGTASALPRCYAVTQWDGTANGALTHIFTNQMAPGNCFVQNSMWFAGSNESYWVEAGVRTDVNYYNGSNFLFWGDMRPNLGWAQHYSNIFSYNDYGKNVAVTIEQGDSSGSWNVYLLGLPSTQYSGVSTANAFAGNSIQVGMEVCGSAGADAPANGMSNNMYEEGTTWAYQNHEDVLLGQSYPAYGYFKQIPTASNYGGQWTTCTRNHTC